MTATAPQARADFSAFCDQRHLHFLHYAELTLPSPGDAYRVVMATLDDLAAEWNGILSVASPAEFAWGALRHRIAMALHRARIYPAEPGITCQHLPVGTAAVVDRIRDRLPACRQDTALLHCVLGLGSATIGELTGTQPTTVAYQITQVRQLLELPDGGGATAGGAAPGRG